MALERFIKIIGVVAAMTGTCSASDLFIDMDDQTIEDVLYLTPYATSHRAGMFLYSVRVEKTGGGGKALTRQQGETLLIPGQKKTLAGLAFRFATGDSYKVEISVREKDREGIRRLFEYPPKN